MKVARRIAIGEADAIREIAPRLARIVRTRRRLCDLELLAAGAYSPLEGFVGRKDLASILGQDRLAGGTPGTVPATLGVIEIHELYDPADRGNARGRVWLRRKVLSEADLEPADVRARRVAAVSVRTGEDTVVTLRDSVLNVTLPAWTTEIARNFGVE